MKRFCLVLIFTMPVRFILAKSPCDLPCSHGPDRTTISTETGWPDAWPEGGPANLMTAGGKLFCLDEKGTITPVPAPPKTFLPAGIFNIPENGPGMFRAHPVVCNPILYIRHDETLFVYDLNGL